MWFGQMQELYVNTQYYKNKTKQIIWLPRNQGLSLLEPLYIQYFEDIIVISRDRNKLVTKYLMG